MGLLSPALANNWKRAILLGLGLLACAEAPPVERPPTVLGRVGDSEINERDFGLALEKLPAGNQAKTLADWRQQFQVLSLIHICRCRRYSLCRSRWSAFH